MLNPNMISHYIKKSGNSGVSASNAEKMSDPTFISRLSKEHYEVIEIFKQIKKM